MKRLELQYVTNQVGERTAVIIPIGQYQELIEDIDDLGALAEWREEPTTSHEDLIVELERDGFS